VQADLHSVNAAPVHCLPGSVWAEPPALAPYRCAAPLGRTACCRYMVLFATTRKKLKKDAAKFAEETGVPLAVVTNLYSKFTVQV